MRTGQVKWFNPDKGYGFIVDDETGKECFVHFSAVDGVGFKQLLDGEPVEYESEQGPKGMFATLVRKVPA